MHGLPEKIDTKFRYVLLAAARAEQMMRGAKARIELTGSKVTKVAMQEIRQDAVEWDYGPPPPPETAAAAVEAVAKEPEPVPA